MKPAFGTLEYTVEVNGGGTAARPALVSVKGLPKDATVALLHKRIAMVHAKKYPARPALHFASTATSTIVGHDLTDSHGTVLAAGDKVVEALARHDSTKPLSVVVRGSASRTARSHTPLCSRRRERTTRPMSTTVYRANDTDQSPTCIVHSAELNRGGTDSSLPREPIRMIRRSPDGYWLSAIDIVRAMASHLRDRDEHTVTRRVMATACRRMGQLDRVLLPGRPRAGSDHGRQTRTSGIHTTRLSRFIDVVANIVHPADDEAAALLAVRYKAHLCDSAPSGPGSPVAYRLGEEDPLSEEPSTPCVDADVDQDSVSDAHVAPTIISHGSDDDGVDDHDDDDHVGDSATETTVPQPSAPSRKRPRSRDVATSSRTDDSTRDDGGKSDDDDDDTERPARRRRTRRRAPPVPRWSAERAWTDLPTDRRPAVGSVDDSDRDCPTPAVALFHTRHFAPAAEIARDKADGRRDGFARWILPVAAATDLDGRRTHSMDGMDDDSSAHAHVKSEKAHSGDEENVPDDSDGQQDQDVDDGRRQQAAFERKWNHRVASDVVERADAGGPVRIWETRNGVCRLSLAVVASHEIAGMWEVVGGRADPHRPAPGPKEEWIERDSVIALVAQALLSPATAVTVGASMSPTSPGAVTIVDSGLFALCRRHLASEGDPTMSARLSVRLATLVHEAANTPRARVCAQLTATMGASP
ncbi:hypothetical protein pclt_cds_36 [Pandoravirus celtis]|uniref:Uncharacterized protein n=1 Tax=Pandoravirus celtis TaxID=2568002 RepID=A0A4D6EFH4_9VIRU|nr:hypothetical protein pclt_cds_36 [Pandoravirus celtis]